LNSCFNGTLPAELRIYALLVRNFFGSAESHTQTNLKPSAVIRQPH